MLGDDDDVLYPERSFQHNTVKMSAPKIDPVRMRTENYPSIYLYIGYTLKYIFYFLY